ncbi:hypothetical protein [Nocardia rhizosphaerihabitans]|uniref:Major facilitator superfamily (MFS) profile domain-containing protein n=1 Tax=Nocardia rhizosphaerihabitans TaxID=1691570 RepID=A0ABQ2K855_9NOCA|nr:hypothetical protein [Nocardia rhizosphaerihabitans]GGN72649.1 hypothetical protein GCM10011610_14110 [Nocardia rhizosphaerihabitans]
MIVAGLAARILQGLTASFFAPAAFAYLAERIAPARRVFALTCLTSSFLGAGVVAQVLAPAAVQAIAAQAGEARGAATALYTFALFLGASAGPQLANLVAGNGFTAVALVIAALGFGGAALALASTRVQRS